MVLNRNLALQNRSFFTNLILLEVILFHLNGWTHLTCGERVFRDNISCNVFFRYVIVLEFSFVNFGVSVKPCGMTANNNIAFNKMQHILQLK